MNDPLSDLKVPINRRGGPFRVLATPVRRRAADGGRTRREDDGRGRDMERASALIGKGSMP